MSAKFEDKYTIGEQLGQGAYAIVYRCTHRERGDNWAVKVIDKSKAGPKDISDVLHEVNMMKACGQHEHVVHLLEFFDTPETMYLVLELIEGGMLFDRIVQMKHYSEACASKLIKNFLLALQHIHAAGIIHRDLKPENLLLKNKVASSTTDISHLTDVVLADFGLSGKPPGQTCCGSPSYIAPEVINVGYLRTSNDPYDFRCDIWSLGVVAYILLSGKMPFHGKNFKETFGKVVKGQWTFVGDVWAGVSDTAKNFIQTMLTLDPKRRPTATEALQHPWVVNTQPDTHIAGSVEAIKQFNAEQKLRGAMNYFRATSSFLGKMDRTPPFLKYLTHENKLSTILTSVSQTDKTKAHTIDIAIALNREQPGWSFTDCCSCDSTKVCRHLQNVHEYYFVGSPEMDVQPFINELELIKEEAEFDLCEEPGNKDVEEKGRLAAQIIAVAGVFQEEYRKVPQTEFKQNFMLASPLQSKNTVANAFAKLKK